MKFAPPSSARSTRAQLAQQEGPHRAIRGLRVHQNPRGWQTFVAARKAEELEQIIAVEGQDAAATRASIENAFRDGAIPTTGTAFTKILPPVSRFSKTNSHSIKKQTVLDHLGSFFERFLGLV